MHTRKLRIVKPPLPAIGICEACNFQFKSNKLSQEETEKEIKAAFDAHECKVRDQTCVRGVFDSDGGGQIRILIADDSERVRRALRNLLEQHLSDWVVCGEVDNGQDAVSEVAKLRPDVILLDASIPVLHGVTVAQIVKRDHPAVAVVMISEQDTSVLALLADAAGTPHYIPKSRMGIDLIPLLTSLVKDSRNPSGAQSE